MKWLAWLIRWLLRRTTTTEVSMPTDTPTVTISEETRRAQEAAKEAAVHLHESRARRSEVDAQARVIKSLSRDNHFGETIRRALGSGT